MKILQTRIFKLSIPMRPFRIATGTMFHAQNVFIRIDTDEGLTGVGECSAFPLITGESQSTCFEMAREFALLWKNKDATDMDARLEDLENFTAFNATAKSAFDMALYDLAAQRAGLPLYKYLKGNKKPLETDLTIGIDEPEIMAAMAVEFKNKGVRIIKIKLGKDGATDLLRVRMIRTAVGDSIQLRIDANQGWDFDTAKETLLKMAECNIEFCEQPLRQWNDHLLPSLRKLSPIKIMADESVFNHHDAQRLILAGACDYVNIKFAKSGGIAEALRINQVCEKYNVHCMMGGMLESRLALTAFAHFALSQDNIRFYDMDTALLGHEMDPVAGGVRYKGYFLEIPDSPGIGADLDEAFLKNCEQAVV
ncbi:MAG TPA: dipeptide epimerase [Puia sp.]|jgi:L-alanine-DL-glutamate epimerase-like enolase superfamily enzyme